MRSLTLTLLSKKRLETIVHAELLREIGDIKGCLSVLKFIDITDDYTKQIADKI
jgi:hypothetical protein